MNDNIIDVAMGMGVRSKIWKNSKISWGDMVEKLREEHRTTETFKEFLSATKEEQLAIKDVGGYVGGYLKNGRRKPENVVHKQLLTLDIDFAHKDFWDDFCLLFDNAAVLHGTHKNCESSPRYRLVMPLSRPCTPDEYAAVSRRVAGDLGIDLFDNTTFETHRLMFWPSNPKDVDYYFRHQEGPWLDVDKTLARYQDWRDTSSWPTAGKKLKEINDAAKKQEDPESKKGIIGAFCRTYSITEGIEKFLSEIYTPTSFPDRYTYSKGTAAAGLIVYEDKFAYSHHGTDPCGGKLCNCFDLIRIHKFGHLDEEDKKGKLPSFSAMEDMARKDLKVKKIIAKEHITEAKYDFSEDDPDPTDPENTEWMKELEVDRGGKYLSTSVNLNLIFANDYRLKGLFRQNDFDGKKYVFGNLPWRKVPSPEPIRDVDFCGTRNYIESIYGISGSMKIDDSMSLEFEKNHYHPVTEYLKGLKWDGTKRIDTLLIEYFGAEDNIYTREAMRKMMVGAVARVFRPGIKFDLVLTLVSGVQGTGKSSFFKALGKRWFSDTFITVQGKEAFEQLRGSWIIEMAELSGLRKADIEAIKHFISKQEDVFRPAYMRVTETFPRQCVFTATTNENNFLRDPSGNRRFMPVDTKNIKLVDNKPLRDFLDNTEIIDQLWAEAVHLYKNGEPLYLGHEAEKLASTQQKLHSEIDERRGIVEKYLEALYPDDWEDLDIYARRMFIDDPLSKKGTTPKVYTCVAEIWCECLGRNKEDMDKYKTREINDIMKGMEEWEYNINATRMFSIYGRQRYYSRKLD